MHVPRRAYDRCQRPIFAAFTPCGPSIILGHDEIDRSVMFSADLTTSLKHLVRRATLLASIVPHFASSQ
eukprot:5842297-Alexandrium_andersonii.AAC.1